MKLTKLLENIQYSADNFNGDSEINNICYDSRKAKPGDLFVCIKGYQSDGHKYAKSAYNNGVRVFAVEKVLDLPDDATLIYVDDTRKFLALASAAFFDYPAKKLKTVAITGTKGKTSISFMLKSILENAGIKTGVIGTTGIYYGDVAIKTDNSTPESYEIHRCFSKMVENDCKAVIIEATSQGFKLDRTAGIMFDIGIYTNLSPDHIGGNEHADFAEYLACKKMLFGQCKLGIANSDSEYYADMVGDASCPIKTYSLEHAADCVGKDLRFTSDENRLCTSFKCFVGGDDLDVALTIPGKFYVYNALAVVLAAKEFGVDDDIIVHSLKNASVKGRMEIVPTTNGSTVIIDYAHNELSVQSLFDTVKAYNPQKVTTVFGCGGNRSKLRRYAMGEIVGNNSDFAIITSDNPRFESLDLIINDILVGMKKTQGKYIIIQNRKEAIEYAVKNAVPGEVVLIIGKGHQLYEEIEGIKYSFNEREIVEALNN